MKRRSLLFLIACGAMCALAAFVPQRDTKPNLLLLDWAAKAGAETPAVAVLIEMGLKDDKATDWSGRATVTGAKLVHREGYRFRTGDKLIEPDAWQAGSHRPLRLPPAKGAAAAKLEPIATVGIVFHLSDLQPDATLTLETKDQATAKVIVPLRDVLTGAKKPLWEGKAVVRRISAATPVVTAGTEDDFPAAAYGPDGTLWVAYISYTLKDEARRIETGQMKTQPASFKDLYTPEFGDQLFVKSYRGGKWSEPIALTGPKEDLVRCAIAVEGNGDVWVTYSANRQGKHDIYARPISKRFNPTMVANPEPRPGAEQKLSKPETAGSHLSPVMCTAQDGRVHVAWQSPARTPQDGKGTYFATSHLILSSDQATNVSVPGSAANQWSHAIAAGPTGATAMAGDVYQEGDYDITVSQSDKDPTRPLPIAASARFEARPCLAYDTKGRLWIAYEEGPEKWGKDYGALDADDGYPLYGTRAVRVVCVEDGKLSKPVAELSTSTNRVHHPNEQTPRYAYPRIGIDGKGRIWLTYRQKFGTRYSTHPGSYWLTFARRLDGDKWSEPIELHHADGLLDHRPVLLPHASGGLLVIHNTDGRYTTPELIDNQIYASIVDLPGDPIEPQLIAHQAGTKDSQAAKEERAAVQRIRDYRVEHGGQKYQLLRGEFHRHTEISWDGGPDGSLEDMFRYAIDAAGMDWIGNGDHDNGAGREYSWWLIQKFTDAYHVAKAFTPMFTYERSVAYPHGHRNCVFAKRGIRTLPRLAPEPGKAVAQVHADDAKMLYRYLKELDGICASHTSATGMGTDWRDHDPDVEPIVEIYQGDRMSYEYFGAPRAGYDPQSNRLPAQLGGWQPAGFIDNAFKKGYRLGFQSSSDHFSTHISYCIVLAERQDREGILAAMKKRHCYGATDDIIVDVRSGSHLMGDAFRTDSAPTLQMNVIGTNRLAQIDILKDSQVVETIKPGQAHYQGTWTDPKPTSGVHYYYIRVQQTNDELAWASPMWIDYTR